MGKTSRDWTEIYAIYGIDDWQTPVFLAIHAISFLCFSLLFLLYFDPICSMLDDFFPNLPAGTARFAAGFTGSVTALSALSLFYAAGNFMYSAVLLRWEMAQRMVSVVPDWSGVRHALDVGSGRGILLNAMAMHLKKEGSAGRVVGFDKRNTAVATLRTAKIEGVQEYVTFREGDARSLPFADNSFDVVASASFVHTVGKEFGPRTVAAAAERMRVLSEVVRVLKAGGNGILWDLVHVPEYVQRLREMNMEEIRVSECVTAFMVSSHIISFRKPSQHIVVPGEVRLDWRF